MPLSLNVRMVGERMIFRKSHIYTAIFFLTLFVIYQYGIHQIYGMSEYPDEFGYWSTAAHMIGWDWSQVASRGSYYSFGYSFILCPILKFCEDSVSAYRVAVFVNFSFMAISFFLLKEIYKRIFAEQVEGEEILAIGLAVLYPAWSFYAQTTLVDSLLIFMVILISYLWIRFVEVPNLKWGIALVAAVIYNYSLHMRSAGILVAVVMILILWVWKHPSYWKGIFFLLLAVIGLFFAVGWIKGSVQGNVFAEASTKQLSTNDFGGQWNKIAFLFSAEGVKQLFVVALGKVLYLGIAGAGLVYVAFIWCGKQVVGWLSMVVNLKKVNNHQPETDISCSEKTMNRNHVKEWFGMLLLLMMLGQMAVCIIATIHTSNIDWLIYGRYIEAFVPMAIFVGASYLLQKKFSWKGMNRFFGIYTLAALSCICKVRGTTMDHIRGEHSIGTVFLVGDGNVKPVVFLIAVWLVGMVLMVAVHLAISCFKKKQGAIGIILVLYVSLAAWSIYGSERYTYKANDHMSQELILVNVLEEQLAEGKEIYYLEEGNADWISYVQMQLREQTLPVINIEELNKLEPVVSAVVVDGETECLEYMEEHYNRKIAGFYHYVFYNN